VHNYQPNGNTYNYFSGDAVTWLHGDNREWEYAQKKKSYSYATEVSSYEKVTGTSKSESEADYTTSKETVYEVAKSTSFIARKEEYEAVGASFTLKAGGAQCEISADGPKFSLGAEASAELKMALQFELTAALKLEIALGKTVKFGLFGDTELRTTKQKLAAKEDSLTAFKTNMHALYDEKRAAAIKKNGVEMGNYGVMMEDSQAKMAKAIASVKEGFAFFL
jgi:hypothetical protein